jgi:uncharacterized protein (TIGR04141 family)
LAKKPGINVPIYKIDVEAVRDYFSKEKELEPKAIPALLVQTYNNDKDGLVYQSKGATTVDDSFIELFHNVKSVPSTSSWVQFFESSEIELSSIKSQFQHLLCFAVVDDELYAFTAGQAAVVFDRFVDISFPIEVGRRITKPEINSARANQITGMTLASDLHFRDARRITSAESLDTVWTSMSGQLRADQLAMETIVGALGKKNKIRVDVSSAIRFGPKVSKPRDMISLIRWLAEQAEGPLPADDGWSALDSIRVLNPRKQRDLIAKLRLALAERVFRDEEYEGIAIMNSEASLYTSAAQYIVHQGKNTLHDASEEPELHQIVNGMKVDTEDYTNNLVTVTIQSIYGDYGNNVGTSGTLMSHLNGELRHEGKTYFLLSGKWYEVDASYIEVITREFITLMSHLDLEATTIGLRDWKESEWEGDYNLSSSETGAFINGDRILTDNVELFDSLEYSGTDLHILHVKREFNVKIRDVRSQVLASAQVIENDLRTGGTKLRAHHAKLHAKGRTVLSESRFMALFERPRVYALCYGSKLKVSEANLHKFTSSVAKMELVSLHNQFRQVTTTESQARLQVVWIPIVNG